ncbi:hypothetical protein [Halobellus ruber]|uniref:DUF8163 domain-containing protein n=1 Tax=Halobellus ruber TaxID=2761102 RepID=A0A7J9SI23_9EURY|nr:hypothetical protein [Halobellus ruber]MBB6646604.1 hypothetical protein [Halobellus ruber]
MSEQNPADDPAGGRRPYTPFVRLEGGLRRAPEFVALGLTFLGLLLQAELRGVAAGIALVVLWTRLRVEFVFAAGALLVVALGGDALTLPTGVAAAGLVGLLAIHLARTWGSVLLGVGFLAVAALAGGGVVVASREVSLAWIAAGSAAILVVASYALHRYQVVRFATIEATDAEGPTDDAAGADGSGGTTPSGDGDARSETV